jgi:hypothetical protein
MLGHIEHHAPELLLLELGDGSVFACTDLFVRKFLKRQLNYVPRACTQASQKIPEDAPLQLYHAFFRLVYACWKRKIKHASLIVNFDQTQVVIQSQGKSTFAESGSKQVGVIGKEEKRAWTAVVGVSADGHVLPTQVVMKGKDRTRSLPQRTDPMMNEADVRGFQWALNPDTYWSSFETMKDYFDDILVPWFTKAKTKLGLPADQPCIVILDVWSVHRSLQFRTWVTVTYPWLELHYIPGGCTGLFQPCDVAMQKPYKQAIKRAQLADTVAATLHHLSLPKTEGSAAMKLDVTIGKLRGQCPRWFVQAFDAIQRPDLVKAAFARCWVPHRDPKSTAALRWNLSFDSITSADAIATLLSEIRDDNPVFWAELLQPRRADVDPTTDVSDEHIEDTPFTEEAGDDVEDSSAHPDELIESIIANRQHEAPASDSTSISMADDLDTVLEEKAVAAVSSRDRGPGKRIVKPNSLYAMDKHDRKLKPKRC